MSAAPRHLLTISDLSRDEIIFVLELSAKLKADRNLHSDAMTRRTLLMIFEKPSLRTRVSFEVGIHQMGGHAIYYNTATSPMGSKETVSDTSKVLSRYCDIMSARVNSRDTVLELARNSSVPVINALDDWAHPCQMLADLQTIVEKKGTLDGLKMAFLGDLNNNVTYDLMRTASLVGFSLNLAGVGEVAQEVKEECVRLCSKSGGSVTFFDTAEQAVQGVGAIYTDSWMSYHIPKEEFEDRRKTFLPYQITSELMAKASTDVIFMNCLPAARGMEQTAEVIDGPTSVVFDEAENRLHAQKALLLFLTGIVTP